jgi:hypothetical protein
MEKFNATINKQKWWRGRREIIIIILTIIIIIDEKYNRVPRFICAVPNFGGAPVCEDVLKLEFWGRSVFASTQMKHKWHHLWFRRKWISGWLQWQFRPFFVLALRLYLCSNEDEDRSFLEVCWASRPALARFFSVQSSFLLTFVPSQKNWDKDRKISTLLHSLSSMLGSPSRKLEPLMKSSSPTCSLHNL